MKPGMFESYRNLFLFLLNVVGGIVFMGSLFLGVYTLSGGLK
jgi:hypothetical protein